MSDLINKTPEEKYTIFINEVFRGEHHIKKKVKDKYGCLHVHLIENYISTFDDDVMTKIVLCSHRLGLRASIKPHGVNGLKLFLSNRDTREGDIFDRHPDIKTVVEKYCALHGN